MKIQILNPIMKSFSMGIGLGLGIVASVAIAITVSVSFQPGDTLTADSLNVLKSAIESIPPWTQNDSNAIYAIGNVGIGTSSPGEKLTVNGIIETTNGGVKFPDGTIQTSAANTQWQLFQKLKWNSTGDSRTITLSGSYDEVNLEFNGDLYWNGSGSCGIRLVLNDDTTSIYSSHLERYNSSILQTSNYIVLLDSPENIALVGYLKFKAEPFNDHLIYTGNLGIALALNTYRLIYGSKTSSVDKLDRIQIVFNNCDYNGVILAWTREVL